MVTLTLGTFEQRASGSLTAAHAPGLILAMQVLDIGEPQGLHHFHSLPAAKPNRAIDEDWLCLVEFSKLLNERRIAAFDRECTRRGVPPPRVTIFGSPFITWRGLPLIPSDKLRIDADNKITILLLHVGESRRGVVGLQKAGVAGEIEPGLSVRCMGTDDSFIASHRHGCEQGERLVICHPRRFK